MHNEVKVEGLGIVGILDTIYGHLGR